MNSIVDLAWCSASPYKRCAGCNELCRHQKIIICRVCENVYHTDCYEKKTFRGLDCNCLSTLPFFDGRSEHCIVNSCTNPPNCKKSRYWMCTVCYDNILSRLLKWLLFQKHTMNTAHGFIGMFLRSVRTPLCIENVTDSNIHFLATNACILTMMHESIRVVTCPNTNNAHRITHIFNVLLEEMKTSGDIYALPFSKEDFRVLKTFLVKDAIDVLLEFKTHLRNLATPVMAVPIINFLTTNRVNYISRHQITDKESMLARLREKGFYGISRHLLLSEYKDAIYDLNTLEVSDKIWVSGDRKMVYAKKNISIKIPGLLETWQNLQNPTRIMNKK